MKNVEMKVENNILTIKVDLTKEFGLSSSGKNTIIASTEGNIAVPEKDDTKYKVQSKGSALDARHMRLHSTDFFT
jgi:hypothetical protein